MNIMVKKIAFADFITKNFKDFDSQERTMLEQWRENFSVSLRQYAAFFKRHNITEDKFVLMSQDEFDQWLDSIYDTNIESKPIIFDEQLLINIYGEYFINFENYKRHSEKQNAEIEMTNQKLQNIIVFLHTQGYSINEIAHQLNIPETEIMEILSHQK